MQTPHRARRPTRQGHRRQVGELMSSCTDESSLRPLARSLEPLAGESLGGYLLRLSCRLRVSPVQLARLTGCARDGQVVIRRRLLLDLDIQRLARATRLSADEASSLALASWEDRYPPIAHSRTRPDQQAPDSGPRQHQWSEILRLPPCEPDRGQRARSGLAAADHAHPGRSQAHRSPFFCPARRLSPSSPASHRSLL